MIKFFRRIRQRMLTENKFSKYLLYAIGEIVLVVIGILIALHVNNKNEEKKRNNVFKSQIEEIYNSINFDVERFKDFTNNKNERITALDLILNLDSLNLVLNKEQQIIALYNATFNYEINNSETPYFLSRLNPNPENKLQNTLVRNITSYVNRLDKRNLFLDHTALNMVRKSGIPVPSPDPENPFVYSIDSNYYNQKHYDKLDSLLGDDLFKSALKTLKVSLRFDNFEYNTKVSQVESLSKMIKDYYPSLKTLILDVGIIGTSINGFDDEGAISTPMIETNLDQSIWEIELRLKKGHVKFRCQDSWSQNWGGTTFPEGIAHFDGSNIAVDEPGLYHITLNLNNNSYKFKKLKD